MTVFSKFLTELLREGKVVFRSAEAPRDRPTEGDVAILAEAFATYALSVAGPPIAFDPRTAREAAELVRQASWALVDREERPRDLRRRLRMTNTATTPAQHLSADLLLRYLPHVLKRARGLDPTDPLGEILGDVLRRWPLSGALSDIEEGPIVSPEFDGHPGLLLLYAERIATHDRPAWRPEPSTPAYDYYQLVAGSRPPGLESLAISPWLAS
jgi:MoxR-vWA-beta-propeller ternary system domain bpX4